jgi:transcriptional regulator with XRE-family HTH domain
MRREPELVQEFGRYIKDCRRKKALGLRELARTANISATYLSQLERGEQRWPTEEVLLRLANAVAHPTKELLHKAGRVSSDVLDIFKAHPALYTNFLEATSELEADELETVIRSALLHVRKINEQRKANASKGKKAKRSKRSQS